MKNRISLKDKIFIAGAKGMAGSAIHRTLLKKGYGKESEGGAVLTPSRRELDLLNKNAVEKWFANNKPNIVIIAAAKVGGILANSSQPTEFLLENLQIQNNLIETSWKNDVKRLLFLGSSCIYPKFANQPIQEESLLTGELEETNESYAIAKIAGIKLCQSLRKQYGFDAISLMPTNLYGDGDNYDPEQSHVMAALINKFYYASKNNLPSVTCWGTGLARREFMHANDLGEAVVFTLESWFPFSDDGPKDKNDNPLTILNVGTGKDITIKELSQKIADLFDYKGDILWDKTKPDGTPKKLLNIEKISTLGWQPKLSLDAGLKLAIESYKREIVNMKI
tara:strand:+ start:610 stop:1620 length:1011 start_codon:yes stop_codon:yes gene_type:complete